MDSDMRVVTDKEVYLFAPPSLSQSETELAFHGWLRQNGVLKADLDHAIRIISIKDVHLPMSVTSVESWGHWSLLHGTFQKREYDRDLRQFERDMLAYQAEERKQKAAQDPAGPARLPPVPQRPERENYYEYFPDNGAYNVSFKGILRAFGVEALGPGAELLNDVAVALDQFLRHGFPAAEAAAAAPGPINRDVLNTQLEEHVSDRGIGWLKEHAKSYEMAKKHAIGEVNYRRECNIVFLPVRMIEYSAAGQTHVAILEPIRNEFILGTPPVLVQAPAATAVKTAGGNKGLMAVAGAALLLLIAGGALYLKFSARPESGVEATNEIAAATPPPAAVHPAPAPSPVMAPAQTTARTAPVPAAPAPAPAATLSAPPPPSASIAPVPAPPPPVSAQTRTASQEAAREEAAKETASREAAREAAARVLAAQEAAQEQGAQQAAARAVQPSPAPSGDVADELTAAANASPSPPPASAAPAPKPAPASKGAKSAPPARSGDAMLAAFSSGQLRLAPRLSDENSDAQVTTTMSLETAAHNAQALVHTATSTGAGNDLGYYYLGVAAQQAGLTNAARTYYRLSLAHSEMDNPPDICSPSHLDSYAPEFCHGIILPSRAERALASLPAN